MGPAQRERRGSDEIMKNKQEFFSTAHLTGDLRNRSVRGGANVMLSQVSTLTLRTFAAIALARMVAPEAYGLIGMVSAFTAFANLLKDLGLAQATIQRPDITHEQVSVMFWVNIALSTAIMLVVGLCAPLLVWFYKEPQLFAITWAVSGGFFLGGLSIQHHALLQRQMRFGTLAKIDIICNVLGVAVGLIMAFFSAGYWALIGMSIATLAFQAAGRWMLCPWMPSRPRRGTGVKGLIKFGAGVTGFNFMNYFSRNLDNILIGKLCGAAMLGFYAKAYSLLMLPITQIRTPMINVGMPALCALRNDPERYARYYRRIIFLLALTSMPLVAFLYVFSDNFIVLLLGARWYPSSKLFQILALAAFVQAVATAGRGLPILSMGFSKRYFQFGVVQSVVTCAGMAVGVIWGAEGVAAGYAAAFYLLLIPTTPWCLKGSPVSSKDWLTAVWKPAMASLVMVFVMLVVQKAISAGTDVCEATLIRHMMTLFFGGATGCIAFLLTMLLLPGGKKELTEAVGQLWQILPKKLQFRGRK